MKKYILLFFTVLVSSISLNGQRDYFEQIASNGNLLFEKNKFQDVYDLVHLELENCKKNIGDADTTYIKLLRLKANSLYGLGEYEKTLNPAIELLYLRKKILGNNHLDVGKSYKFLANISYRLSQYDAEFEYVNSALLVYEKYECNEIICELMQRKGSYYYYKANYEKSNIEYKKYFVESNKCRIDTMNYLNVISGYCVNLGMLYLYKKEVSFLDSIFQINKFNDLIHNEKYLAQIFKLKTQFVMGLVTIGNAKDAYNIAFDLQKYTSNEKIEDYPKVMLYSQLAAIYKSYHRSYLAISSMRKAFDLGINSKDPKRYEHLYLDLAIHYKDNGYLDSAFYSIVKIMAIHEDRLYKNTGELKNKTDTMSVLNSLMFEYNTAGLLCSEMKEYTFALTLLNKSLLISEILYGADDDSSIPYYMNLGMVYKDIANVDSSIYFYEKAIEITENSDIDVVINYKKDLFAYYDLIESYIIKNNYEKAFPLINRMLIEGTKASRDKLLDLIISYNNQSIVQGLLNHKYCFNKYIDKNYSDEYYRDSRNNNDKLNYNKFINMRIKVNKYSLMTFAEIKSAGIDIYKLQDSLVYLESRLDNKRSNVNFIDFNDIENKIQKEDAYIQFINYKYFNGKSWTDSVLYAAYVVLPDQKEPVFVKLFEQAQLDSLMLSEDLPSMMGKLYQSSDSALYNLVWKPIAGYLGDAKKVYIAPSGQLHKMAFAAIGDGTGNVLSDKYEIHQVLSAQDFVYPSSPVVFNSEDKSTTTSIAMFGGINYDLSNTTASEKDSLLFSPLSHLTKDLNRGSSFEYLPGTKKEIESIQRQFKQNNKTTLSYSGSDATEVSLRSLEGDKAPKILHIATHGYFLPDTKEYSSKDRFSASNNPLIRSGLMMAGSNASWKGTVTLPGEEDGILTAQEVSNLNLLNTQLVVLSACETGLGEIKGREGVFGLQRAFRLAGAKYLLLSLWSIPDKETSEYMELFYSELLKQNDISKAYRSTQTILRQKNPISPMKWAGMVLVE